MCIDELKLEDCFILWVPKPRKHNCQTLELSGLQKSPFAWRSEFSRAGTRAWRHHVKWRGS